MAEFDLHQDKLTRPPFVRLEKVSAGVMGNHLTRMTVWMVCLRLGAMFGGLQDLTVQ